MGKLAKVWSGCCKEGITDADNFVVEFPPVALPVQKAALMACTVLVRECGVIGRVRVVGMRACVCTLCGACVRSWTSCCSKTISDVTTIEAAASVPVLSMNVSFCSGFVEYSMRTHPPLIYGERIQQGINVPMVLQLFMSFGTACRRWLCRCGAA